MLEKKGLLAPNTLTAKAIISHLLVYLIMIVGSNVRNLSKTTDSL
jgi:hypothetical protein